VAQHEIDHLDGILFTERIEDLSTLRDMSQENKPKRRGLLRRRKKIETPVE
jgi:peptide deformylase